MSTRRIPIQNLYFLLCYAWDVLPEADLDSASFAPEMRLQDLLASVLSNGVTRLLKQGLDRAYLTESEELAGVRGRLDISASLKQATFTRGRAWCVFDELSSDILHNRIVKATLRSLAATRSLDAKISEELRDLYRRMPGVGAMRVTQHSFHRVTLGRNSAFYGFLLDVCELVFRNLLVDEESGEIEFRDFTQDDRQMARVFEKFLFRFFTREQQRYKVTAPRLAWRAEGDADQLAYLPSMRTDIVLSADVERIIIDAKYYSETLSDHLTKQSVRSGHLYQMFSYMSHLTVGDARGNVRGILLYPRTTETVRVSVRLFEHPFLAATINLAQPWSEISNDLLDMLSVARS